jgi:hypothetical protein
LKVIIGIEGLEQVPAQPARNGPLYRRFQGKWIRAYFDVGNVVISGYPQDWIRTGQAHQQATLRTSSSRKREVAEWVPLRGAKSTGPGLQSASRDQLYRLGHGPAQRRRRRVPQVSRRFDLILTGVMYDAL